MIKNNFRLFCLKGDNVSVCDDQHRFFHAVALVVKHSFVCWLNRGKNNVLVAGTDLTKIRKKTKKTVVFQQSSILKEKLKKRFYYKKFCYFRFDPDKVDQSFKNVLRKIRSIDKINEMISVQQMFEIFDFKRLSCRAPTKYRGFQGVVKLYDFGGGMASHGVSLTHRRPGGIGCHGFGRVIPGTKMPRLVVAKNKIQFGRVIRKKDALLFVGSVPGRKFSAVQLGNFTV